MNVELVMGLALYSWILKIKANMWLYLEH